MPSQVRRASAASLLPILIIAILAVLLLVWLNRPGPGVERDRIMHGEVLGSMTGLARPVNNKLAAEYTDANGDGVADAPSDVAKHADPAELTFSYVAADQGANNAAAFAPLMEALSKATGKPVRILPLTDLDAQLHAVHDGALNICAFNTGSVPVAVDAAGFVPVSVLGNDAGASTIQLKLLASNASGITSVDKIRGEEVTLTEMGSNSGFKAPLVLLEKKFDLKPGRDYAIRYSGGHQQSIEGLAKGTYSIVAVASDVLARNETAGTISPGSYKVLYTSDSFPTACFGYAHNLKPELAKKIEIVLSDFGFAGNAMGQFFGGSGQTKLVRSDYKKDFAIVRDIDDSIGSEHTLRPLQPPVPENEPTPATSPAQ